MLCVARAGDPATMEEIFRARAKSLHQESYVIIGLIITLLFAAVYIFFQAAHITASDAQTKGVYNKSLEVKAEIDNLKKLIPSAPVFAPTKEQTKMYNNYMDLFLTIDKQVIDKFGPYEQDAVKRSVEKAFQDIGRLYFNEITEFTEINLKKSLIDDSVVQTNSIFYFSINIAILKQILSEVSVKEFLKESNKK